MSSFSTEIVVFSARVSFAITLWKITLRIDDFPAPLRPISNTFCFAAFRFNLSIVYFSDRVSVRVVLVQPDCKWVFLFLLFLLFNLCLIFEIFLS